MKKSTIELVSENFVGVLCPYIKTDGKIDSDVYMIPLGINWDETYKIREISGWNEEDDVAYVPVVLRAIMCGVIDQIGYGFHLGTTGKILDWEISINPQYDSSKRPSVHHILRVHDSFTECMMLTMYPEIFNPGWIGNRYAADKIHLESVVNSFKNTTPLLR